MNCIRFLIEEIRAGWTWKLSTWYYFALGEENIHSSFSQGTETNIKGLHSSDLTRLLQRRHLIDKNTYLIELAAAVKMKMEVYTLS